MHDDGRWGQTAGTGAPGVIPAGRRSRTRLGGSRPTPPGLSAACRRPSGGLRVHPALPPRRRRRACPPPVPDPPGVSVSPPPPPTAVPPIRVPAGTTAQDALKAAGVPLKGPDGAVVVRDLATGDLRDLAWAPEVDAEVEP